MSWSWRKFRRSTKASGPPNVVIKVAWSWGTKLLKGQLFGLDEDKSEHGQGVLPYTAFKRFSTCILQRTYAVGVGVNVATFQRILKAEGLIQVPRLEESLKSGISSIREGRSLGSQEEVLPVSTARSILLSIHLIPKSRSDLGDDEVVVAVLESS